MKLKRLVVKKTICILLPFVSILFWQSLSAQISLPKLFGDKMVLQRDIPVPVWGNAEPGVTVLATLGNSRATAKADSKGEWMLRFPKFKAGGPYTLRIVEMGRPGNGVELKDILIGDVWLASGQSNMEWEVRNSMDAGNEIAKADYPRIRFLSVGHDIKLSPQSDISTEGWKSCDSNNVKKFSAVAYFFARKIHREQNVPVGILQTTWGGTPVESWTSREALLSSPITRERVLANDTLRVSHFSQDSLNMRRFWEIIYNPENNSDKTVPSPEYADTGWATVEMPRLIKDFGIGRYEGMMWLRKKVDLPASFAGKDLELDLGRPEMNYSLYFNGVEICKTIWNSSPSHAYRIPAKIVKPGPNTISLRMAILWGGGGITATPENFYLTDGVSKTSLAGKWSYSKDIEPPLPRSSNYQYYPALLFNAMLNPLVPYGIKGFIWYQGEANEWNAYDYRKLFPLMITDWRHRWKQGNLPFLYVQLANYKPAQPKPSESEWAELRESQTLTLSLPNTGMACIIDIGDGGNIHPSNKQEVGRRLALLANKLVYKKDCVASGPMYKSFKIEGDRVRIRFTGTGSGLAAKDGNKITGFSIAGADRQFYWAKAVVEGNEIVVYSDNVRSPSAVRYAWADNPDCNLINKEGLPAIPFRTDDWRGITQKQENETARF